MQKSQVGDTHLWNCFSFTVRQGQWVKCNVYSASKDVPKGLCCCLSEKKRCLVVFWRVK